MRWWKKALCIVMAVLILAGAWNIVEMLPKALSDPNPQDALLGILLTAFGLCGAAFAFFFLTGELKLMKQEWARRGQLVSAAGASLALCTVLLTLLAIPAFAAGEIGAGLFFAVLSVLIPWVLLSTLAARLGIVFPKWKKRGAKQRDPSGQASSVQRPVRMKPLTVNHEERAAVRPDQAAPEQRPEQAKPLTDRVVQEVRIPGETATMRLNYQVDRYTCVSIIKLEMTPAGCYLDMTDIQGKSVDGNRVLLPEAFLHLPIDQFLDEIDVILAKNIFDPLDRTQVDLDALRAFLDTPMQQTGKPRAAFFRGGTLVFEAVIENGVVTEYTGPGGVVKIPDGVTAIGDHAFEGCGRLTGIVIPEGVTSIGVSAFRNCTCLKSAVLPQSLKRIGKYAFMGCRELQCPEVRDGVEVGKMAFSGTIPNN